MDTITFNVSERNHSASFFESLTCSEDTFRTLFGAAANKTLPGVSGTMQPNKVFSIHTSFKKGTARMEVSQRRGYKSVTFYSK